MAYKLFDRNNKEGESMIFHDAFQDPFNRPPHEYIFTKMLLKEVNENYCVAEKFIAFQETFFKNFNWKKIYYDMRFSVNLEANRSIQFFEWAIYYQYYEEENYERAHQFGEIATEFFIRCYNYSLITKDIRKVIITSEQNCDKVFKDYLEAGYSLQRLQKRIYVRDNRELFGYFITLPVLPTNIDSLDFDIDEFIEDKDGNLVKVLKKDIKKT